MILLALAAAAFLQAQMAPAEARVDFARDIRPILSNACFKCHGPDEQKREGKLRLDERDAAVRKGALVPGNPGKSEALIRILSKDPEEVMPPPAEVRQLGTAQKELLRRWIAEGAEYAPHWAFIAPKPPPAPSPVRAQDRVRGPVDAYILARLEAAGLSLQPEAGRETLARRAALDLTGLPPTLEELDAFLADPAPDAYERYVDRLLASPHYGERWARRWLDLARYADTNGYEKDRPRTMWPYRDWLIRAYNRDLPFDRFTVEQLAGDMLPGAGPDARVATGFHRNTMINEEGGIDPLEFRFHALVDRVNTTGTVWLGLTLVCAQCHTHKYDPIPQKDYYRVLAFFNGADEPEMPVPDPEIEKRRAEHRRKIDDAEAALESKFPPDGELEWTVFKPSKVDAGKSAGEILDDGSVRVGGETPEKASYAVDLEADLDGAAAVRVEVLADPALPRNGPGRADHGNFVLSELSIQRAGKPVTIAWASATFEQDGWPVSAAFDGKSETGWAIATPQNKDMNVDRSAVFHFDAPQAAGKAAWRLKLDQNYGHKHVIGRFRVSLGRFAGAGGLEERRKEHLARKLAAWIEAERAKAVRWEALKPAKVASNLPLFTIESDASVFVHGDMSKSDVYQVEFDAGGRRVTALRLEALTDERLPRNGPGRVHYEGPAGDFWLSEIAVTVDGKPVKLVHASQTIAGGGKAASQAIDGDPQTGWSINGGQGKPQTAVFRLEAPAEGVNRLDVRMLFERYYAAGLGRFRISVTGDDRPAEARGLAPGVEALLLRGGLAGPELRKAFLQVAPELAGARKEIERLRDAMPRFPTTLVMQERDPAYRRRTTTYHRGEFLHPRDAVEPEVFSIFAPLPPGAPRDRLSFAKWLVDGTNPLTGRVVMNRLWQQVFGRGLVRTTEDFGLQGEAPTHPELLDWLALEFVKQGWSWKAMLRILVTSSTYRQASRTTPEALAKDPENKLLSRSPRTRLDSEQVRDAVLRATGLLSPKMYGPSVFPPQPPGITTEGAYGPLTWTVSSGEDRYRRGLYTFMKRTAPYAMTSTFDGPSGEACLARREASNTPLQALTLLNDAVAMEAARHAGRSVRSVEEAVRRALSRRPTAEEQALLERFLEAQKARLAAKELDAVKVAGPGGGDPVERAAWTLLVRALLNLDEFVTRN
jgi:hypothetical protein